MNAMKKHTRSKKLKWRVQWYNSKGLIRQEWCRTQKEAFKRESDLWARRIDASVYREG